MMDNLIYAVISTIEGKTGYKCGKADKLIQEEIEKLKLSLDTKRLFQWSWFIEDIEIGPNIYSSKSIVEIEKNRHNLSNEIIEIGFCPNGDSIFLRDADSAILYWSHDESEDQEINDESLFLVYDRVEYLLLNICNSNFIPWDSNSGQDYFELYQGK